VDNDCDGEVDEVAPEVCADGLDNDCNGVVDDPNCGECGDGTQNEIEECDDGNQNDGDGCSANCIVEVQEAQITQICGLSSAPDFSFCGGNCSSNTEEFTNAYCVLAGFSQAISYVTHTSESRMSYYYNGGNIALTNCSQIQVGSYGAGQACTCVTNLTCQ
jgi:cysteine-rich repeat protein